MIKPITKTVGAYEAKTHLPALLKQVARGKEIIITKRDRPVAKLVPIRPVVADKDLFDKIRAFRERHTLPKGVTARALVQKGRRI